MAVDIIARAMASKGGGGGGTSVDAYTKEQTDTLLYNKADKSKVYTKSEIDTKFSETNENVEQNMSDISNLNSEVGNKANSADVYTKIESDSRFLNIDGTAKKAVADENGKNISESFATDKNDIAINRTTLGTQCKNLFNLKSKVGTYTSNGITFVINDDGSVTANGTATANVFFYMLRNDSALGNLIYGKEVKLTGCPEGGSASTYSLRSLNVDGNSGAVADLGEGRVFTYTNTEKSASFYIAISKGMTVTDLTFYPMLRYAEIIDDTYEPYQPSVQEQITDLISRVEALENK